MPSIQSVELGKCDTYGCFAFALNYHHVFLVGSPFYFIFRRDRLQCVPSTASVFISCFLFWSTCAHSRTICSRRSMGGWPPLDQTTHRWMWYRHSCPSGSRSLGTEKFYFYWLNTCTGIFLLAEYCILAAYLYRNVSTGWIFCTGIFLLAEHFFLKHSYWLNIAYRNISTGWIFCIGILTSWILCTGIFLLENIL